MTSPDSIFLQCLNNNDPADESREPQIVLGIKEQEEDLISDGILAGQALDTLRSTNPYSEPFRDASEISLNELIQYIIRTHHNFIREEMPRLHALCERMIAQRKWLNPELIDLARKLRRLSGDLTFHMSHSECNVFPYIAYIEAMGSSGKKGAALAKSLTARAESLIEEVMAGHARSNDILRQLEADTHGFAPPEDACPDLICLYEGLKEIARRRRDHVTLEGYFLFPRAIAIENDFLAARIGSQ